MNKVYTMGEPCDASEPLGVQAREPNAHTLRRLLIDARRKTIHLLSAFAKNLGPLLEVPLRDTLNPPLWEFGHIAWFQDYWIVRFSARDHGWDADPNAPRWASPNQDALYNSSDVPHNSRWSLLGLTLESTQHYLHSSLDNTLNALDELTRQFGGRVDPRRLYFFQLVLFHELMHHEALIYSAQSLGLSIQSVESFYQHNATHPCENQVLAIPSQSWLLGWSGSTEHVFQQGFVFDNELNTQSHELTAFDIDTHPVSLKQFLSAVQAGVVDLPLYIAQQHGHWMVQRFGQWLPADMDAPVVHVSWHQARAYSEWIGRALPSEAQWECAVMTRTELSWGQVWEWTSSYFEPYDGFVAHPYRDYSAPWFGSRRVLRGACAVTHPAMVHTKYRNYFTPDRQDIYAGFRTCSQPAVSP